MLFRSEFARFAGQTLTFRFTITNTGNVPLDGPVTVSDTKIDAVDCPALGDGILDVGEATVCTGDYTVTEADVAAGRVRNVASARIDGVVSNEDRVIVPQAPMVAVLLDATGSVKAARMRTIDRFNAFLDRWQRRSPEAAWSLWTFNSIAGLRRFAFDIPIVDAAPLTTETYKSTGKTPLYDAAFTAIKRLRAARPTGKIIFTIMSDGNDNASTRITKEQLAALIADTRRTLGWTFLFEGPRISSLKDAVTAAMADPLVAPAPDGQAPTVPTPTDPPPPVADGEPLDVLLLGLADDSDAVDALVARHDRFVRRLTDRDPAAELAIVPFGPGGPGPLSSPVPADEVNPLTLDGYRALADAIAPADPDAPEPRIARPADVVLRDTIARIRDAWPDRPVRLTILADGADPWLDDDPATAAEIVRRLVLVERRAGWTVTIIGHATHPLRTALTDRLPVPR